MMKTTDSDQLELKKLLVRCSEKDTRALKTLYQNTSSHLFAVVLRILKNESHAEDCLQQVFIKVWNNAGQYNADIAKPMTWLSTIARNQSLDWLRRYKNDQLNDGDEVLTEMSESHHDTDHIAQQWQASDQVHHCLGTLNKDQRQCIELAYFDGYSHQELSDRLMEPLGTVKTWIRRGLERLKSCMNQSI